MSAAVMHDLPLWDTDLVDRAPDLRPGRRRPRRRLATSFTSCPRRRRRDRRDRRRSGSPASPVRWCDLARGLSSLQGSADRRRRSAAGPGPRAELAEALARCRGWRGVVRARRTVAFLDPRSESVGESCSRVRIAELGLPAPDLQVELSTTSGASSDARTSGGWSGGRSGEFDGMGKYGALRRPDQTADDVVIDEKDREDACAITVSQVVRWRWDALQDPTILRRNGSCAASTERPTGATRPPALPSAHSSAPAVAWRAWASREECVSG